MRKYLAKVWKVGKLKKKPDLKVRTMKLNPLCLDIRVYNKLQDDEDHFSIS